MEEQCMFNVTLSQSDFKKISEIGFILDDSQKKSICIRGLRGEPLLEIIQLDSLELLIMNCSTKKMADMVEIRVFYNEIVVYLRKTGLNKTERIELKM